MNKNNEEFLIDKLKTKNGVRYSNRATKLRMLRMSLNIQQNDFANLLGVPVQSIRNMETDRTEITDFYMKYICFYYGIDYDWFKNPSDESLYVKEIPHDDFAEMKSIYTELTEHNRKLAMDVLKVILKNQQKADDCSPATSSPAPNDI